MLEISVPHNYLLLLKFITAKYLVHMCEQKELKSCSAVPCLAILMLLFYVVG